MTVFIPILFLFFLLLLFSTFLSELHSYHLTMPFFTKGILIYKKEIFAPTDNLLKIDTKLQKVNTIRYRRHKQEILFRPKELNYNFHLSNVGYIKGIASKNSENSILLEGKISYSPVVLFGSLIAVLFIYISYSILFDTSNILTAFCTIALIILLIVLYISYQNFKTIFINSLDDITSVIVKNSNTVFK